MTGESLFRKDAIDASGDKIWGDVLLTQPVGFWVWTTLVTLVFISIAVFSSWGTINKKASVVGYLQPDKGISAAYALRRGVVSTVLVASGESVSAGQDLVVVDTALNTVAGDPNVRLVDSIRSRIQSEDAAHQLKQRRKGSEISGYSDRLALLHDEVLVLEDQHSSQKKKVLITRHRQQMYKQLASKKFVSQLDSVGLEERLLAEMQRENDIRLALIRTEKEKAQVKELLQRTRLEALAAEQQHVNNLSQLDLQLIQADSNRQYVVKASIDGVIAQLNVKPGSSVQQTTRLLEIVPAGSLLIGEVLVPSRAAGFVKEGQRLSVRYAAYPHQQFGSFAATISNLSETVLVPGQARKPIALTEPAYTAKIDLALTSFDIDGKTHHLKPGLIFEADVILEERTILAWFFEPISALKNKTSS